VYIRKRVHQIYWHQVNGADVRSADKNTQETSANSAGAVGETPDSVADGPIASQSTDAMVAAVQKTIASVLAGFRSELSAIKAKVDSQSVQGTKRPPVLRDADVRQRRLGTDAPTSDVDGKAYQDLVAKLTPVIGEEKAVQAAISLTSGQASQPLGQKNTAGTVRLAGGGGTLASHCASTIMGNQTSNNGSSPKATRITSMVDQLAKVNATIDRSKLAAAIVSLASDGKIACAFPADLSFPIDFDFSLLAKLLTTGQVTMAVALIERNQVLANTRFVVDFDLRITRMFLSTVAQFVGGAPYQLPQDALRLLVDGHIVERRKAPKQLELDRNSAELKLVNSSVA
jgi:hypothetical protein